MNREIIKEQFETTMIEDEILLWCKVCSAIIDVLCGNMGESELFEIMEHHLQDHEKKGGTWNIYDQTQ